MINDGSYAANVYIYNTEININFGVIYQSHHVLQGRIDINNMSIITSQLYEDIKDGLLTFGSSDTIFIDNLYIMYKYDTTRSCIYNGEVSNT